MTQFWAIMYLFELLITMFCFKNTIIFSLVFVSVISKQVSLHGFVGAAYNQGWLTFLFGPKFLGGPTLLWLIIKGSLETRAAYNQQ